MRKELLLKERDLEQGPKEHESEPQGLIGPTSAQAENSSRDRRSGHNQPANIRETAGLRQNVIVGHRTTSVGAESLPQGLTRSPSPVSPHNQPYIGSTGSTQENPRTAKSRGWIRRLSMPVLSSLDGPRKTDSPVHNDSSQTWRSSLALPETKPRHRKASLDTLGNKSNRGR